MPQPLHQAERGDETKLLEHLANTMGVEAEKAMMGVNWEHTTDTPTVPTEDNPQATETQTSTTPRGTDTTANPETAATGVESGAIDFEKYRDPNGLILGKYKTPEATIAGMHSLLHMAKSALERADKQALELDQLRRQKGNEQPAPEKHKSEKLNLFMEKVKAGQGIEAEDVANLIEGIDEQIEMNTRYVSEKRDHEVSKEQAEWEQVDAYMTAHHPRSMNFVDEMRLFSNTNSEVGRVFNRLLQPGDATAKQDATLYLWQEYSRANPQVLVDPVNPNTAAEETRIQAAAQVRKEEVDKARKDAGLVSGGTGGVHESTTTSTGPSREDIEAAANMMRQMGAPGEGGRLWREMTIAKDLNHPLFNP